MAVQAHHSGNNLLHSSYQFLLANRDSTKINQETAMIHHEASPIEQSQNVFCEAMNIQIQSDSGLTYNAPRKRQREQDVAASKMAKHHSFLENGRAFQIQRHHCDVDRFVADHTERLRVELEKHRRREARAVVRALEERIWKRDEEIARVGKLNWALQERVKALCVENQLWKGLAESNEAEAAALRSDLDRVLSSNDDDAESCCGENDIEKGVVSCKGCGEEEARVLLLPCRHLCLCALCGSHFTHCPVCHSTLTASVRVNFS